MPYQSGSNVQLGMPAGTSTKALESTWPDEQWAGYDCYEKGFSGRRAAIVQGTPELASRYPNSPTNR